MSTKIRNFVTVCGQCLNLVLGLAILLIFLGLSTWVGLARPSTENLDPRLLYSYETGLQGWSGSIVSNNPGGTVAITTTHATHGNYALQISSLPDQGPDDDGDGGFFSVHPYPTLDFTGYSTFKFDVHVPVTVTVFVAFQTGSWAYWVQSQNFELEPGDHTVTVNLNTIHNGGRLPGENRVDAIHIYYGSVGTFVQDYLRLEGYVPPPTNTPLPTLGPTVTPQPTYSGLHVIGPHLYDHCGERILLRGINKMVIWTDINGNSFPEIAKTGANSVRIVWLPTGSPAQLDAVIQRAIDNGLIPMVGLWNTTGDWSQLVKALEYWVRPDVLDVINKYERYLLVNIGNEPGDQVSEEEFKSTYAYIIRRMRQEGIHTPLVVDAPGWGKDIDMLQAAGPYLLAIDPDHNLIFDVHTYWPYKWGWSDARVMEEFAETATLGLPLIIGEFANAWDNDGTPEDQIPYKLIIQEAYRYGFGYYPWEWGPGNYPGVHLNMTHDGTYDTLHGWGLEVAITDPFSILNTSDRPYSILHGGVCESGTVILPRLTPTPYNDSPSVNLVAPPFNMMIPAGSALEMEAEAHDFDGTISKVEFYVNGVLVGQDTVEPYTYTVPSPATGEYWLKARAIDDLGATGESTPVYVIAGIPPFFSVNDTVTGTGDYQFEYTGDWRIGIKKGRFHDDDHYSFTAGDCFTFRFTGTQVQMYVATAPHHGIATVSVDNGTPVDVDLYSLTAQDNVMIWQSARLPIGSHTIHVCVSGRRNTAAKGITVSIDRMFVTSREIGFLPLLLRNAGPVVSTPTPTATPTVPPSPTPTVAPPATRTPYPTRTPTPTPTPGCIPAPDVVVYDDATTWDNWSWNSLVDFAYTGRVYSGTHAISVTYTVGWGGFSLHTRSPINTAGYRYISFYAYGGTNGTRLRFYTQDRDDSPSNAYYDFDIPEGVWTHITVTLTHLGNPTEIARLNFQDRGDPDSATYYLDEIVLVGTVCEEEGKVAYFYSDGLNDSWSWGGNYDATVTSPVHSGANAIGVEYTSEWGALRLHPGTPFNTTGFDKLVFYAHPNGNAHQVNVYILEAQKAPVDLPASNEWIRIEVPLSSLGNPSSIADVQIQDRSGGPQPVFYVDDIRLEGSGGAMAYIYTDSLLENAGTWGGTIDFASTDKSHTGVFAISMEITSSGSWGGFNLKRRQGPLYTAGYDRVVFYVHPNGSAHQLLFQTQDKDGNNSPQVSFNVPSENDWVLVEIPLSSLGNPANIMRVTIQDGTGTTQPLFYIDDIMLVGE